jgi:hypothetical protein
MFALRCALAHCITWGKTSHQRNGTIASASILVRKRAIGVLENPTKYWKIGTVEALSVAWA